MKLELQYFAIILMITWSEILFWSLTYLYQMLTQRHGDRYTDRFMQTFNDAPKNKEVQTTRFGLAVCIIYVNQLSAV